MYPLGDLPNEPAEPMAEKDLTSLEARLKAEWSPLLPVDRHVLESVVAEVRWLQRRLRTVEHTLAPIAAGVRHALTTSEE